MPYNTLVYGTVVDLAGTVWANAIVTAVFLPSKLKPNELYTDLSGNIFDHSVSTVTADDGSFSFNLTDNSSIVPSLSQWYFSISPNATMNAITFNLTVLGTAMGISAAITAASNVQKVNGLTIPKVYNVGEVLTQPVTQGTLVYNSILKILEFYDGTSWRAFDNSSFVTVLQFGAVGDGVTDNTVAFQSALNSGSRGVFIPPGDYAISGVLTIPAKTSVTGVGKASNLIGTTSGNSMFTATSVSDINLSNFQVTMKTGFTKNWIIDSFNISIASFDNLTAFGLGIIRTNTIGSSYATIVVVPGAVGFNSNNDISVNNCFSDNKNTSTQAAVLFNFVYRWSVSGCTFINGTHGVQWWGGDSNTAVNGAIANERKNYFGVVNNCHTSVMSGAGVWGSMGQNIVVSNNTVSICYDIGLDDEGGVNNLFIGNYVEDCVNGCMETYWLSLGIRFESNICVSHSLPGIGGLLFSTHNASQAAIPTFIVKNNSFICYNGIGAVTTDSGVNSAEFTENKFFNSVINLGGINLGIIYITNNTFDYDRVLPNNVNIIFLGTTMYAAFINNNRIVSVSGVGSRGIYVTQGYFNGSTITHIEDNFITGPTTSIAIAGSSANAGVQMRYNVMNNSMSGPFVNNLTGTSFCYSEGNIDTTGIPNPSTIPTTGGWVAGSNFRVFPPTAGGFFGAVCVTSGFPGTWKTYGAIST